MKSADVLAKFYRGEFDEVDCLIDQLREHKPISEVSSRWFALGGLARYFSGDFVGAKEDYLRALSIDSEDISALSNLAYLSACCPDATLHDANSAVQLASVACKLTKWQEWSKVLTLAAAYARKREFDQATKYVDIATSLAPDTAHWRFERLRECISNRTAFTGNIEDDFERLIQDRNTGVSDQ